MTRPAGSAKLLRAINSSATLSHLLTAGRLTRAELRDLTGLSKPTSSEMLRLLTDAGLAVVAGRTAGGPGPTAEIYAPNADAAYVVAISVRDTTGEDRPGLAYAVGDLAGEVRHRDEQWVDFTATSPAGAVASAVELACTGAGVSLDRVRQIQIGVAGSYDRRTDTIHHIDVPGWNQPGVGVSIRTALDERLSRPGRFNLDGVGPAPAPGSPTAGPDTDAGVAIENDVNLAAIAERRHGTATAVDSFAMLWLDHGLGLAMDLGGTLLRGTRGSAGEIGYLPLYPTATGTGPAELAGTPVDLQDLVGGPAVIDLARQFGVSARTPGAAVTAALDTGLLDPLARRIAHALATVVAVLDPPLVVLAGTVAQAGGDRLRQAVVAAMNDHSGQTMADVAVAVTGVEDDAVLLGGLDAGLRAVREALIESLSQT